VLRRQDVGHRIVVRRIVGTAAGRTQFSDALGELVELTETHLTVATSRGKLRVPLAEVHRAKRVPAARRPTAASVVALELAANEAWPAPVQDRLGGWLLRSADGWTGRANSALPIGDPDRPLPAAIDAVERWYLAHGQPPMINVPLPLAAPVGAALDERGWGTRPLSLMQTAPLAVIRDRTSGTGPPAADLPGSGLPGAELAAADLAGAELAGAEQPVVELAAAPSPGWLALAVRRKATAAAPGRGSGLPPAALQHLLTAVPGVRFAHLYRAPRTGAGIDAGAGAGAAAAARAEERELLAVARGTVTGHGRWLGLMLIEVVPHARRRGLAQQLLRALADWAAGLGATDAFLQVEERNAAAVGLYRRLGFTTHHTYLTRLAPRPPD
jgi:GNAT superfamily N-acetyltransferase